MPNTGSRCVILTAWLVRWPPTGLVLPLIAALEVTIAKKAMGLQHVHYFVKSRKEDPP